jgi:phage protein D
VGHKDLDAALGECVMRTVVDSRVNMPTMIEITFRDSDATVLEEAGITFGTAIEVRAQATADDSPALVGAGEVTAIEGDYFGLQSYTLVRAYDRTHLLQRSSRVRTFTNMSDSDIARSIASAAGLRIGTIESTSVTHDHLGQMNQTDWDFLTWRSREIGYEFGVDEDGFFFRPAARAKGTPVPLALQRNLRTFRPRVTAGNMAPEVEMRVWDPLKAEVVSTQTATKSDAVRLDTGVSDALRGVAKPRPPAPPSSAPSQGPQPSSDGRILTDRAPAFGEAISAASKEALQGPAGRLASSFAEAQAVAWGDPRLRPGAPVQVSGPPKPFTGRWTVGAAQHVFDDTEGGYRTRLQLGNAEYRTLLGLAAGESGLPTAPRMQGLVCGVVTDVNDPRKKGRVKVKLPWLAPEFTTDWAPVVQVAGGKRAGAMLLPEVHDQVLLGFELGDPRRPYVVGGILSDASTYTLGGPAVEATGSTAEVVRRGIVSPVGNMLAFHDKVTAPNPPTASAIVLGTQDASLLLAIDQVAGTVTLGCQPKPPNSKAAQGAINIVCGDGGAVNITAGTGGSVNIDGGSSLTMKAMSSIKIESTAGTVAIKGAKIELN